MGTPSSLESSRSDLNDLGYCQGSNKEKMAMLESKCRSQQPQQSNSNPDLCDDEVKNKENKGPPIRRTYSDDIKGRVQLLEKAMSNSKYNTNDKRLDRNDPNYGRPLHGTWTAERGAKAHNHVQKEILELCEFIYLNSCEDEDQRSIMLFGDLFKLYTRISDKVVG